MKSNVNLKMTIKLLLIGKTTDSSLQKLTQKYANRLKYYNKFEIEVIRELRNRKNLSTEEQKNAEGQEILKRIRPSDEVILLDEKGKEFNSVQFSDWLQKKFHTGRKQLIFVVGGPYGFSEEVYQQARQKIALSKMTFSHEMIRLFFVEQLYRAFTILRNEPYHHE